MDDDKSVSETDETDPAPPKPAGRKRPSLGRFITSLQALVRANPILSLLSVILLFLVGWFAEVVLDRTYQRFFPDAEQVRAQVLREQIANKTDTIASKIAVMETNLSQVGNDSEEARLFLSAAQATLDELRALRPDIRQLAEKSDRFTERLAGAKANDLAGAGHSAQADFVIPDDGGMTLCPARFTMGMSNVNHDNTVMVRLSRNGEMQEGRLQPGQTVRLDSDDAAVTVSYLGEASEDGLFRFNFDCLASG